MTIAIAPTKKYPCNHSLKYVTYLSPFLIPPEKRLNRGEAALGDSCQRPLHPSPDQASAEEEEEEEEGQKIWKENIRKNVDRQRKM